MSVEDRTCRVLKAATYDAAGPTLRSVGVPAAGTAGEPLKFTVNPFDVWPSGRDEMGLR